VVYIVSARCAVIGCRSIARKTGNVAVLANIKRAVVKC
jgi:hypothetical protein